MSFGLCLFYLSSSPLYLSYAPRGLRYARPHIPSGLSSPSVGSRPRVTHAVVATLGLLRTYQANRPHDIQALAPHSLMALAAPPG